MNEAKLAEVIRNRTLINQGFQQFTKDCEPKNLAKPGSWEFGRFISEHQAVNFARNLGWGRLSTPTVQMRRVYEHETTFYLVEPWEEDCKCPNIIQPY